MLSLQITMMVMVFIYLLYKLVVVGVKPLSKLLIQPI